MITEATWTEIHDLHRAGTPIKQIARRLCVAPNTVRRALRSDTLPRYVRVELKLPVAVRYLPQITELLEDMPRIRATWIAEEIGWPYSMSLLRRHVAQLRAAQASSSRPKALPAPEFGRGLPTVHATAAVRDPEGDLPGRKVLCGIWQSPELPVGHGQRRSCPVLVMTFPYSQVTRAVMVPSRDFASLWLGQWTLLAGWNRMPWDFVWEEMSLGSPSWLAFEPYRRCLEFRGQGLTTEARLPQLRAARDELESTFLPERCFRSPSDFNAQLSDWIEETHSGSPERHRMWEQELAGMLGPKQVAGRHRSEAAQPMWLDQPLPSLLDKPSGSIAKTMPSKEGVVSCDGNGYVVGRWGHGRKVAVDATLDRIVISSGGYQSGGFHRVEYERVWARNVTVNQPTRHLRTVGQHQEELAGP